MARDVSETDFAREVLDRSHEVPVVVDFWAAWCAPCRFLGPILERVAAGHEGRVDLVKIDTDANPQLAAAYGIRGIPAVKAFRDGEVVDEFTGAQPEESVRAFFEALLADEDRRTGRAQVLAEARDAEARGEHAEARRLLATLPADAEVSRLLAEIDLAEAGVPLDRAEEVLGELLARVARGDEREEARAHMVRIFEVLGHDHPLSRRYRGELSKALFA